MTAFRQTYSSRPSRPGAGFWNATWQPSWRRSARQRALHAYLRWHNANARHRDVLAAERKERARIRSEKGIRWGGRPLKAVA
ncbi:hypothetical protein GTY60_22635 [Streptomyces sp. SID8367]|nr:hypothetical protein [Streptomyces sp. SID8367]